MIDAFKRFQITDETVREIRLQKADEGRQGQDLRPERRQDLRQSTSTQSGTRFPRTRCHSSRSLISNRVVTARQRRVRLGACRRLTQSLWSPVPIAVSFRSPARWPCFGTLWACCFCASSVAGSTAVRTAPGDIGGSDHVDAPVPEYPTGDECLFCHRDRFGEDWAKNAHDRTLRRVDAHAPAMEALRSSGKASSAAGAVEFLLGEHHRVRYLKPTGEYGKLALLSAEFSPPAPGSSRRRGHGALRGEENPKWDDHKFALKCVGCHATAVDPQTHAYSAIGLDCFACHGLVEPRHSKDAKLIFFGKGRQDPPRVAVAICAQCHLRTGKSRKTGLPYPTNFVAGDNLFRDFEVDLSDTALAAMNPGDRHVAQNVREALDGKSRTTCVTCHNIHGQSAVQHRKVAEDATCVTCHEPGKPMSKPIRYEMHSKLCEY